MNENIKLRCLYIATDLCKTDNNNELAFFMSILDKEIIHKISALSLMTYRQQLILHVHANISKHVDDSLIKILSRYCINCVYDCITHLCN